MGSSILISCLEKQWNTVALLVHRSPAYLAHITTTTTTPTQLQQAWRIGGLHDEEHPSSTIEILIPNDLRSPEKKK